MLLPMTVVASVFGMNFQLRVFTEERYDRLFYAALAGMALITIGLLI